MARPKKVLVEKVSIETGIDEVQLDRLPVEDLKKIDALVPDEKAEGDMVLVGVHPITGEPVYV